ncbi:LAGLIDADG family homing endonuclease [Zhaonella formicivorans]|uniref:LAGLIDADG family homing endonuclease n=1 Tax=Zhaonella formicivorans TaxID=2528593 RepID=UPI0010DAEC56|nr:LAGLIDADG family homing endonuclease [Zhaonella formicivorans]
MQVLTTCQNCGKEFLVIKKELNRGNGRFCSRKCSAAFGNMIRNKVWKKNLLSSQGKTLEISDDFGHYISGLVDGEGSFIISFASKENQSYRTQVRFTFKLELTKADDEILKLIQNALLCGRIHYVKRKEDNAQDACRFIVQSLAELNEVVIPFFDKFKLKSSKLLDYEIFKECLALYLNSDSADIARMIYQKRTSMNNGGNKSRKKLDIGEGMSQVNVVVQGKPHIYSGHYVSGLVDGEGCFSVIISRDSNYKAGIRVKLHFTVTLAAINLKLLTTLKNYFGCGNIYYNKAEKAYVYSVQSFKDNINRIIPFFDRYPLRAKKRKDFAIYKEIANLIRVKRHLTEEGIAKIFALRAQMEERGINAY